MAALMELALLPFTLAFAWLAACFALEIVMVVFGIPLLIMGAIGKVLASAFQHAKVWDRVSSGGPAHQTAGAVGSRAAGAVGWVVGAYAGIYVVGFLVFSISLGLFLLLAAQTSL